MLNKVLKRPILTEKALKNAEDNIYTFEVALESGKKEIEKAVEKAFDVEVVSVKTNTIKGKRRRIRNTSRERKDSDIKKALVVLKKGQKLDIFSKG